MVIATTAAPSSTKRCAGGESDHAETLEGDLSTLHRQVDGLGGGSSLIAIETGTPTSA